MAKIPKRFNSVPGHHLKSISYKITSLHLVLFWIIFFTW